MKHQFSEVDTLQFTTDDAHPCEHPSVDQSQNDANQHGSRSLEGGIWSLWVPCDFWWWKSVDIWIAVTPGQSNDYDSWEREEHSREFETRNCLVVDRIAEEGWPKGVSLKKDDYERDGNQLEIEGEQNEARVSKKGAQLG